MKILSSASARPNFVKLAAVHHALAKKKGVEHVIVHTGQHYDPLLSDIFFEQLNIPMPKHNLGIKGGSDREAVIAETAKAFEEVLEKEKPDSVLVYGDVNGAVGAARAAKKLGIRLGHVEAGLRSFDKEMPEELNRIEIDQIADELFTTEKSAEENIKEEGLKGEVRFVGNTMIDTLVSLLPLIAKEKIDQSEKFVVATIHRPSNVDNPEYLRSVLELLVETVRMKVVLPVHPRTRHNIESSNMHVPAGIKLVEPLGYIQFLALCSHAQFIITDSGGIQEEAVILGKKCFTLRRNTERPSTIQSGSNDLIDLTKESDRKKISEFEKSPHVSITVPELWDGKAGERIADILCGR
jgi:UDP-N-acetylglucosamine 2-epimerase (non-hydrolysing)